jgi:hypothetical protein
LGSSSSQLTFTPSFFRGVGGSTTNQIIINHHEPSSLTIILTIINSILTVNHGNITRYINIIITYYHQLTMLIMLMVNGDNITSILTVY